MSVRTSVILFLAGAAGAACTNPPTPPCPGKKASLATLTLASEEAAWDGAQIAFDGQSIWVAFSAGVKGDAPTSNIELSEIDCNGGLVSTVGGASAPLQLNTDLAEGRRPVLAAGSQETIAAWSSYAASASKNQVESQSFSGDQASSFSGAAPLPTTLNGATFMGDVLAGGLAAQAGPDGVFILTGARSTDPTCLTPFMQWISGLGGSSTSSSVDAGMSTSPGVGTTILADAGSGSTATDGGSAIDGGSVTGDGGSVTGDGTGSGTDDVEPAEAVGGCVMGSPQALAGSTSDPVTFAWEQVPSGSTATGMTTLYVTRLQPDHATFDAAEPILKGDLSGFTLSEGVAASSSSAPQYLAVSTRPTAASVLQVEDLSNSSAAPLSITEMRGEVGTPFVAGGVGGGVVGWTETSADGSSQMTLQAFTYDGASFQAKGQPLDLSSSEGSLFGRVEALTHLTNNAYVVVWSDADTLSGPRTLKAKFVLF